MTSPMPFKLVSTVTHPIEQPVIKIKSKQALLSITVISSFNEMGSFNEPTISAKNQDQVNKLLISYLLPMFNHHSPSGSKDR